MKKFFFLLIIITVVVSCSEGDVVEDDVNFDGALQDCSNGNNFVIFKINDEGNQAISLNFSSTNFELNSAPADNVSQTLELNANNNLIYRQFDTPINGDEYFCASIPPGNIMVTRELISANGTATISYSTEGNVTTRTITLSNITFLGTGVEIRQEVFNLGSYDITSP
ncbi:hypothetical protein [Aquimarina celericrescens]|uniref:Lipocalin-like domain-containing protein n=1 Tax=Aquimarina celericrescens TaxID=1964542 RepID=A0ABW5B2I7_9FLAO|nr:hypothetical protein [Aquimarina celericrescens]